MKNKYARLQQATTTEIQACYLGQVKVLMYLQFYMYQICFVFKELLISNCLYSHAQLIKLLQP